jgi:hypothetical protein
MEPDTDPPETTNMRKSGDWMVRADERILERLVEVDSVTPKELAEHEYINVSRVHLSNRLSKLADHDLVDRLGNGVYQLTAFGWYYLAGEYDADSGDYLGDGEPDELVHHTDEPILWSTDEE